MIQYTLKEALRKHDITQTELQNDLGISSRTMAKFAKNQPVSLSLLDRICTALDCSLSEIVTIQRMYT
jgi:DNA (cytosine-5)-methyltransferase 1